VVHIGTEKGPSSGAETHPWFDPDGAAEGFGEKLFSWERLTPAAEAANQAKHLPHR
jgi:hypothetical protein